MPNILLDLHVDRVDLVDEGANSHSYIKLYKRKETDSTMTFEEIIAKMKPEHATVINEAIAKAKQEVPEETQKELEGTKKELETKSTELKDKDAELEEVKKSKPKETDEPDFEEVMKSLDPSVQKMFADLQSQKIAAEEVAKRAAEEKINQEAIAKAKDFKALPVEEAELVTVLKSASPEVMNILAAANKAISESSVFEEVGKSKGKDVSTSAEEAWDKIEKKAKVLEDEHKVSKQRAISMAVKENPELYKEYLEGGAN